MTQLYPDLDLETPPHAPVEPPVALRAVPDWPVPLGHGVLPEERTMEHEVVCRQVIEVTHDVRTLVLEPTRPDLFCFTPGQYLTLGVEIDGRTVERCYTISSPPTRPHLLTITVKRLPGGELSPWLHDELAPGQRLRVRGPMGSFSVTEHPARGYLMLSAGSGITPTLSTLRTMADLAEPAEPGTVVVVHSARSPEDLVCRAELEALAASMPALRLHWVCEQGDPGASWTGHLGRLGADLVRELVPDVAEREIFTCGPPGYMSATRAALRELGVDADRCHEEAFVLGAPAAPEVAVAQPEARTEAGATVSFSRSGRQVLCPPGTTVLEAARQAGVLLPSSCTEGLCGTCKSTLLSGQVQMNHQGGIRPREIAQGKFLPCCSTPDGDLVVDA